MKTGIPTNGSMVRNHISLRMDFGRFATRKSSFFSWFQVCQACFLSPSSPAAGEIQVREREDAINSDISPVPVSNSVNDRSGRPDEPKPTKIQNQIKRKPR